MWARTVEVMLGCWLILSPFIFRHEQGDSYLWSNDILCGVAIIFLALLSYWRKTEQAHFAQLLIAAWLFGQAFLQPSPPPPPPAYQNHIVLAFLLLMFAIIPNRASIPPKGWREYYRRAAQTSGGCL